MGNEQKLNMKTYECQKLWQPLICATHGAQWVANIHDETEEDENGETYTIRSINCAVTGCHNLMREIRI